ncbi:MAG: hypothetical protein WCL70_05030 [Paludibacter sp.]
MKENDNKEINLLQLLEILINWIKTISIKLIGYIGKLIQMFYKHLILTIIILAVCIAGGLYLSRPEVQIYKADALGIIYGNEAQTVREISKQLENSSPIITQISFQKKLMLPDSVAKNIVAFHSYNVIEYVKDHAAVSVDYHNNFSQKDTMYAKMRDRVYFRLLTKNISQVPIIEKAILDYFNKNEMLQTRFLNARNYITNRILWSRKELNRIDSLAKVNYFKENDQQLHFDKNKLIVGEQQKQLFYNDLLKLQDILSDSESNLKNFKQPLDIPSGLVVDPIPINNPLKYIAFSIIIGLIISTLIIGLLENLKVISNFLKNKK